MSASTFDLHVHLSAQRGRVHAGEQDGNKIDTACGRSGFSWSGTAQAVTCALCKRALRVTS